MVMAMAVVTSATSSELSRARLPTRACKHRRIFTACNAHSAALSRRIALVVAGAAAIPFPEAARIDQVREVVRKAVTKQKSAGLLRLVFHDAGTFNSLRQTGGMNGSIVYELDRPENAGLDRPFKVLQKVKGTLEQSLQVISWADLIAVAGAEAVLFCGGPFIPVRLGRLDTSVPDPEGELPGENFDANVMKEAFQKKGFSIQEMVALSGAHTLGSKGFGNPYVFDNSYYDVLLKKPWTDPGNNMGSMIGLPSDRALADDEECLRWLKVYKEDQGQFFTDFSAAYLKMIDLGTRWAD